MYNKIEELMDSCVFSQIVTSPTHTSPNSEPSIIDLVFISNMHLFEFCNVIPQLTNSDHLGLPPSTLPQYAANYGDISMRTLTELMTF